jgi:hypothetical protein
MQGLRQLQSCRLPPSQSFVATTQAACRLLTCVSVGTPNILVRYCFYPGERFTLERPNSIELEVGKEQVQWTILFIRLAIGSVLDPVSEDLILTHILPGARI